MYKKGVILGGGSGSRLSPITNAYSKHLIPIFDRPIIYFPIATLMLANIRDICIVCNEADRNLYKAIFKDLNQLGLEITLLIQHKPNGIADALMVAEKFTKNYPSIYCLGDNFFYGRSFTELLLSSVKKDKSIIFGYESNKPNEFGVLEFLGEKLIGIEEKPSFPKSNLVVTGIYLFSSKAIDIAKKLDPSFRGEIEITDVIKELIRINDVHLEKIDKTVKWFDLGTPSRIFEATCFIEKHDKLEEDLIGSPHLISYRNGWIKKGDLVDLIKDKNSEYFDKVKKIIL